MAVLQYTRGLIVAGEYMAHRAAVAAGSKATAEAAATVLREGGNAFDAAIAGIAAACIAEPVLCSLFGGGFLMAQPAASEARVIDFFTQTPGRTARDGEALDFFGAHADFGTATQEFHIGRAASAVPGMIPGLFHIHETLGRMPMADILAPARALARDGVELEPLQAGILQAVSPIFCATETAKAIYTDSSGRMLPAETRHAPPQFGDFLDALIAEGPRLVTEGEVAQKIETLCQDGGLLTRNDLARYAVSERPPRRTSYRDANVALNDLPSSGGPLIQVTLALLQADGDLPPPGSPDRARRLIDALTRTGDARRKSGFAENPGPETMARLFDGIPIDAAHKSGGTTHLSIVDSDGALASVSLSNGEGNGHIVPGTGQMMNNMLGEEDLNPTGFFKWRPDTRVTSMMTPCLVTLADGRKLALGSGGSNRIRSAIVQTLSYVIDAGLNLTEAVSSPRLHVEGGHVGIEEGLDRTDPNDFPDAKFWPPGNFFFGGVHVVGVGPQGSLAAGDPRRGGQAIIL